MCKYLQLLANMRQHNIFIFLEAMPDLASLFITPCSRS